MRMQFFARDFFSLVVILITLDITPSTGQTVFGPNSPGNAENNPSIGAFSWANAQNSLKSDDNRSNGNGIDASHYLTSSNFGFAVPSDVEIDGIVVEIERSSSPPAIPVSILDDWTTGFTKVISPGVDRCLIVIAATENGDGPTDVTGIMYGGKFMTPVGEYNVGAPGEFNNRLEIWMLLEDDIVEVTNNNLAPNISATSFLENAEIYSSIVFQHVDQRNPFGEIQSSSITGDVVPYRLENVVGTLIGSMMVTAITCGENSSPAVTEGGTNTYTIDSDFAEGIDAYYASPFAPTSGASLQTATKQSSAVGFEQPTFTFSGAANRQIAVGFTLRGAAGVDHSVRLIKGGIIVGNDYAKPDVAWPTSDTYEVYGGPTDLWGTTWTPDEINASNFGVAVSAINETDNVEIDHIRITLYTSAILPVELLYFTGNLTNDGVLLQWETATEINNDYFLVERSGDGIHFEPFAKVDGAGTSNTQTKYEVADRLLQQSTIYYRLRQVDFDGAISYSPMISVHMAERLDEFSIFPNPASTKITIRSFSDEPLRVNMMNTNGSLVFEGVANDGERLVDVSRFPAGVYIVELVRGTLRKRSRIVVER